MPKNDEGEFELVLGNKQLLSVFFIVVVLLGVFFTMGYIVGRNTGSDSVQVARETGQPLVVESEPASRPAQQASPGAGSSTPSEPKPAAAKPVPAPAKVEQPPKPVERPKPAPPKAAAPSPGGVSTPAEGQMFLQVAATSMPEAEVLRDVLRKRGFSSQLAPVPGQDVIRVLVGPLDGSDDAAQTRGKLQDAGFKPFLRRY